MNKLGEAIDTHGLDERLVDVLAAWLKSKNVTLWQTFDLSEDLEAAAEWLADTLVSIDIFAHEEYVWEDDEDDEHSDRVRPSGIDGEDSDVDPWDAHLQWA